MSKNSLYFRKNKADYGNKSPLSPVYFDETPLKNPGRKNHQSLGEMEVGSVDFRITHSSTDTHPVKSGSIFPLKNGDYPIKGMI
jgi:hypothetical protein